MQARAAVRPKEYLLATGRVIAGSLIMALGARIAVEIGVVPVTMQLLALAAVAALLGSRLAPLAMIAYLVEGASGLPFFAGGVGGPQWLVGLTAGYLWSFPLAAYVIARGLELPIGRTYAGRALVNIAGLAVVYVFGFMVLAAYIGGPAAFATGVLPFIAIDVAKMMLAAFLPPRG